MIDDATQAWLDAASKGPDHPGRAEAREAFAAQGLPHRRMEDWKYTDLRNRLKEALPMARPQSAVSGIAGDLHALGACEVQFGNGYFISADQPGAGIDLTGLGAALREGVSWATEALGTAHAPTDQPMLALNAAMLRDGLCLKVQEATDGGAVLLSHQGDAGRQIIRNLIILEPGASLTLIEAHNGGDGAQQIQQVSEILVGEGASLTHIRLQDAGIQSAHLATDIVNVAGEGAYRGFVLTTGSELSRQETFIEFLGENAHAEISGSYLLSGAQHADITTRVNHAVPHCTSREVFKGVIADTARGVFQGRIYVAKDAQKTDGEMLNKTLLLSEKAEIDAKPELEIYADDVKCAHGATTGQLDDNHLFYLRARGIDEVTARGLLVKAFLAEAMEEVHDDEVRAVLMARTSDWLDVHGEAWKVSA